MRLPIKGFAVVGLMLIGAARVEAQFVVAGRFPPPPPPPPVALVMPYASAPIVTTTSVAAGVGAPYFLPSAATYGRIRTVTVGGAYLPPYSYYALPSTLPARYYAGYGGNTVYPYYGRRYGLPNDAWSWPYLSGGYYNAMARYYSPPLGF